MNEQCCRFPWGMSLLSFVSGKIIMISAVAETWINPFYLPMVFNY